MINEKIDLILCIFWGWCGVHKFYERDIKSGVVYLFTFGLFGVGWIVDIINMCTGRYTIGGNARTEQQTEKETIQTLSRQIYHQKEDYERRIEQLENVLAQKNSEIFDLKGKFNIREEEPIIAVKEKENKFVLNAGKYKGGISIPIGIYDLNIVSGSGIIETDVPEKCFFRLESDEQTRKRRNWSDKYNGLEIGNGTILKISESANVKFSYKYDFEESTGQVDQKTILLYEDRINKLNKEIEKRDRRIQEISDELENVKNENFETNKELEEERRNLASKIIELNLEKTRLEKVELQKVKDELKILNDECIQKYYDFSSYDSKTSQDCKNELIILKQKEQEMRREERDVRIRSKIQNEKTVIRQLLRMFNAECDNIMISVSTKNIDKARHKIQQSFDTANRLCGNHNVMLSQEMLNLKLEQVTLMYTYELKYQQEKDIQKTIKEQMLEEAKAQREIEEQKKKIEKDLQQHLGEINRMMKYMQKTQIDAEKQLYMDKIKELEEKIKILEADKETVSEREANAKAGFVYIISNIGSFGDNIYKIGMTRRLEPMDRIKELSSASVPFEFDVHAMIFSSDAPELETTLHKHFANKAVNKVNPRKEFYNVDIDEIEKVVKENYNDTVQFVKIPIAAEYRQTLNLTEKE